MTPFIYKIKRFIINRAQPGFKYFFKFIKIVGKQKSRNLKFSDFQIIKFQNSQFLNLPKNDINLVVKTKKLT